jgi:DNA-binding XRE family transcriptional regulator
MPRDFLEEIIEESAATSPGFRHKVDAAFERRVLARKLAERRRELGLTQAEAARRMNSNQPEVSKIERGGDVRLSTLERYTEVLGCSLALQVTTGAPPKRR